eukprot:scaffold42409_cov214-Amphora_coffeaeformis.AAC.3
MTVSTSQHNKCPSCFLRFLALVGVIVMILPMFVSPPDVAQVEQQQASTTLRVIKPPKEPIIVTPAPPPVEITPPAKANLRPTSSPIQSPQRGPSDPVTTTHPTAPGTKEMTAKSTTPTSSTTKTTQMTPSSATQSLDTNNGLNFCRTSTVPLPSIDGDKTVDIFFTCQGPLYDAYSQTLIQDVASKVAKTASATTWGRRDHALPPNSQTLVLGDGHIRQLAQVMLCQQSSTAPITSYQRIDKYANVYTFANNATLLMVTNAYALFADQWQELLEQQIQRPLQDFTTIVLGLVDECNKDTSKPDSYFTKTMKALDVDGVDCMTHDPPTLDAWRNVYHGPLVWMSPFSTARRSQARDEFHRLQQLATAKKDSDGPLAFVNGRQYLQDRDDCMAASRSEVADCENKATSGNPCTGATGGLADLVAWDVIEFLWTMNTTSPLVANVSPRKPWQDVPVNRDDLTYCTSPILEAPRDPFSDTSDIHYQCAGPKYDAFIEELHPFAYDQSYRRPPHQWWGRRNFGIPSHKRVLFYGNSHTRQVAKALACQQMEMDRMQRVISVNTTRVHQYDMVNNSTLVAVTNTFAPYSRAWVRLTEEDMGMKLDSFDALVIGTFNNCGGNNGFSREMINFSKEIPDVDCVNTPPPSLKEIAEHFPGPIIYVTMFIRSKNEKDHASTEQELHQIRMEQNRTNVYFVEARQYVDATLDCRGQERFNVSDCWSRPGTGGPTHECTGPNGGHADLIAWDVIEYLYQELES